MARILILAKNPREAGSFAALMGWRIGQYRAVQKASSISGVRRADVFVLPSFLERHDRHAILGALRWAKYVNTYYVDPADIREPSEATDCSVGPTDREIEVAYRYNALRERDAADDMVSEGGPVVPEPVKPKPAVPAAAATSYFN